MNVRVDLAILLLCLFPLLGQAAALDESRHRAQLVAQGIEPTPAGLRSFFAEVTNSAPNDSLLRLIDQLGSSSYTERIAAQQHLMRQPSLPLDQLRRAAESSNPEIAYRAATVLKNWIPARERTIEAALWVIADEKLPGLTQDVFNVITVFREQDKIMHAAEQAIVGTAQAEEQTLLVGHIEGHDRLLAHLALGGFLARANETHVDRMLSWSERQEFSDPDRLKLALAVARLHDVRALDRLIGLLRAEDRIVAVRANIALQSLTGEKVSFSPTDAATVEKAVDQWKSWRAGVGDSFALNIEKLDAKSRRSNLNGNTLIALGYKNQVVELNPQGEEVWRYDALGVWSAEKTADGDVLLACYQENKVKLITPQKTVAWEYDVPGVLKARCLENGNYLIASHSGNKVLEVSPDKSVVWEYVATTQCHDAARLESGDTMVCTANEVLEVDAAGNVTWRFAAEQAYGIDVLPNGNVLVAKLGGEVIEIDRATNSVIWTYAFASPVDVYRTDDGTTLITGAQTVVEIDSSNNPIWSKDIANFGSARK